MAFRFQGSFKRGFHAKGSFPQGKIKPVARKPQKDTLVNAKPGAPAPKPVPNAAPPKPPTPQKPEFDSTYYNQVGRIGERETTGLSRLEGDEARIKHDFGIGDPTNPFSRAEGLKRAFLARFRGTSAGIAAQGKLYTGRHDRALAKVRRDESEARQGLREAFDQAIGNISDAKQGLKFDSEDARNSAFEAWLARAPEAELTAPSDDGSGTSLNSQHAKIGKLESAPLTLPTTPKLNDYQRAVKKFQQTAKKKAPKGKKGKMNARVKHVPKKKVKERLR